jgi:carnitine-CoA ligase
MNLRDFIEGQVARNPQKTFLFFTDEEISYEKFDGKVNQAANAFLEWGVKKGDRVCLLLPNIPEFLYGWFGLMKIGAVMVPINPAFRENEAGYIVNHSEAMGILVDSEHSLIGEALRRKYPTLRWIGCVGEGTGERVLPFRPVLETMPRTLRPIFLQDEDVAQIIYTSGTTGFPKGVIHVQKDFPLTGEAFLLCADITPEDRLLTILPLFHANAQYYSTMGALAAGASLILIQKFSAGAFWKQAVRTGATEFNFIGAIGRILCARPTEEFRPDHRIRTAYGALVTPDVYQAFTRRFKIPNVIDGYGLSEVPRVSQNPIGGLIKMKSMGLPAKHPDSHRTFAEVKIVDEKGVELGPNQTGELIVRSPVMMKGYFKEEEKTRETIQNGWLYTGDYAYRDEAGYLFFIDRKKDIIRRRGENISATEVETLLLSHPKIGEAAVVAVPAELGEDEVLAALVVKENQVLSPEEAIDWCRERLADFKIPRFIQFRTSFPYTPTGRIAKYLLREEKDLRASAIDLEEYKRKMSGSG